MAQTLTEPTAAEFVQALRRNGEDYHVGRIGYAEWDKHNRSLWQRADLAGVSEDVKRLLRHV